MEHTGGVRCELTPPVREWVLLVGAPHPVPVLQEGPRDVGVEPSWLPCSALTLTATSPLAPERPGECTPTGHSPGVMGCPQATRLGLEDPHGLGKSFSGWG